MLTFMRSTATKRPKRLVTSTSSTSAARSDIAPTEVDAASAAVSVAGARSPWNADRPEPPSGDWVAPAGGHPGAPSGGGAPPAGPNPFLPLLPDGSTLLQRTISRIASENELSLDVGRDVFVVVDGRFGGLARSQISETFPELPLAHVL